MKVVTRPDDIGRARAVLAGAGDGPARRSAAARPGHLPDTRGHVHRAHRAVRVRQDHRAAAAEPARRTRQRAGAPGRPATAGPGRASPERADVGAWPYPARTTRGPG